MTSTDPATPTGNTYSTQPTVPLQDYDETAPASPATQYQEVVFVDAPVPPKKRGNRLAGVLLALLATIVYTALVAAALIIAQLITGEAITFGFLVAPTFYYSSVLFLVAMALVVLIMNNSGWWTYIISSLLVALAVYFGTAGLLLLSAGIATLTQTEATDVYVAALLHPLTIAAALLAREVAIWTGAILGRRGRKVRARNAEAKAAFEREQAELIPASAPAT